MTVLHILKRLSWYQKPRLSDIVSILYSMLFRMELTYSMNSISQHNMFILYLWNTANSWQCHRPPLNYNIKFQMQCRIAISAKFTENPSVSCLLRTMSVCVQSGRTLRHKRNRPSPVALWNNLTTNAWTNRICLVDVVVVAIVVVEREQSSEEEYVRVCNVRCMYELLLSGVVVPQVPRRPPQTHGTQPCSSLDIPWDRVGYFGRSH